MSDPREPRLRLANRSIPLGDCTLDQAVPDDHPVRIVAAYVAALDLTAFRATIRVVSGVHGRNATDPRILLLLWLYATIDGIGSARKIDRLCGENIIYRWILGGVTLNYHTISTFRHRHATALDRLLVTHVGALLQQGLIELKCVAQDGMKTRASAGSGSFHRAASIEECQQRVAEQVEALKQQAEDDPGAVNRRQEAARQRHARERQERLQAALQVAQEQEPNARNASASIRRRPPSGKKKTRKRRRAGVRRRTRSAAR